MKHSSSPRKAPVLDRAATGVLPVSHRPGPAPSGRQDSAVVDDAEAARNGSGLQGAHSFNVLAITVFCVTLGASFYGTFTGEAVRFPFARPEAPALRGTLPAADFESGARYVTPLQSL